MTTETSNARGSCYEGVCPDCNNFDCDCDAPPPSAPVGVDAPGSRSWMAEVCRAAALSLAAHGVRNDQLSKVADWIAQQPATVDRARFRKAPCYLCGYNGAGYFQSETHPCAALYHATQPRGSDNG